VSNSHNALLAHTVRFARVEGAPSPPSLSAGTRISVLWGQRLRGRCLALLRSIRITHSCG